MMSISSRVVLDRDSMTLEGTLLVPERGANGSPPVALIISGSGATDRDGNSPGAQNNALKMLAEALADQGIASLRYDKRGVGASAQEGLDEEYLRFEHFAEDARAWLKLLRYRREGFSRIIVIGHSEGSLLGMLAAEEGIADLFISIAGAALPANEILMQQLMRQEPTLQTLALPTLKALSVGELVKDVDASLYALFRPSVQPYLISWFKYDPAEELHKLTVPVLLIQGTEDLQVGEADVHVLAKAKSDAALSIISGMNHVLKQVSSEQSNLKAYSDPTLPIMPELVIEIVRFIRQHYDD